MRVFLFIALLIAGTAGAHAADDPPHHVEMRLLAETTSIAPGSPLNLALNQIIQPGWHTYWTNPGDAGEPVQITWHLPNGFTAGVIQWPAPQRIPVGPLMNFGYENRATLLAQINVPRDATPGSSVTIGADLRWLACADICVPEEASVSVTLPIGEGRPDRDEIFAADFMLARQALPKPFLGPASITQTKYGLRLAVMDPSLPAHPKDAAFFPAMGGIIVNAAPQELSVEPGAISLLLKPVSQNAPHAEVDGILRIETEGGPQSYLLQAAPSVEPQDVSLPVAILFAVLGGLILNLMPCVLPVLSMKALVALDHRQSDERAARYQGLAYGLGVVLSFLAFAAVLYALRETGHAAGWGFQFQSPVVVMGMALLFIAIALNLAGFFEVSFFQSVGSDITTHGISGSFLTGVLAVLVASPCTAPFMAAAVGIALSANPAIMFAIFAGLGVGLAAPFVILSFAPALLRALPRPGPWMATFKRWLALPMLLTGAWLFWVLHRQTGIQGLGIGIAAALGFSLALAVFGRAQRASRSTLAPLLGGGAVALGVMIVLALTPQISSPTQTPDDHTYSAARLEALRGQRTPVFVNVTAAWCITCQVNETVALGSSQVRRAFAAQRVSLLTADWTLKDPEITALLQAYGRNGVPLYLYFAPNAPRGRVLPQILVPGTIIGAIAQP